MWRKPSTIPRRDAWYDGTMALMKPTSAAATQATSMRGRVHLQCPGKSAGLCARLLPDETPPAIQRCHRPAPASPLRQRTGSRIVPRVKPRVFSTATSRVRSRIDIAMVFAETSKNREDNRAANTQDERLHIPQHRQESQLKCLLGLRLGGLRRIAEHIVDRRANLRHIFRPNPPGSCRSPAALSDTAQLLPHISG